CQRSSIALAMGSGQQEPFSSFSIIVKFVTGKADGVWLHAQCAQLALALSRPPAVEIQEILE
ncbi:hypothetical protein, partial [Klebsiella aerogenes]|uniref:hypothetical protein n=1 Tax=Klebsiella aerogenes TaxID=548 RepID=UPI0019537E98